MKNVRDALKGHIEQEVFNSTVLHKSQRDASSLPAHFLPSLPLVPAHQIILYRENRSHTGDVSETDQDPSRVRKAHCDTANSPAPSCQMDAAREPVLRVFLSLTLKPKTRPLTIHLICQYAKKASVTLFSYCAQWTSIQTGNKTPIFQGSESASTMTDLSVCLSRPISPFLLLMTQAGIWQVMIISQAEEAILFWGREDMQNMFLWYSPGHCILTPRVWELLMSSPSPSPHTLGRSPAEFNKEATNHLL